MIIHLRNRAKNRPPSPVLPTENRPRSPVCRSRKPPARSTTGIASAPRSPPRSAATPLAAGADQFAACGSGNVASARGPHSRSFAREPPHPHLAGRLVPRRSRPGVRGGSRATESSRESLRVASRFHRDFRAARAVPHAARPSPGLAAERVRPGPIGPRNFLTPLRPPTPAGGATTSLLTSGSRPKLAVYIRRSPSCEGMEGLASASGGGFA